MVFPFRQYPGCNTAIYYIYILFNYFILFISELEKAPLNIPLMFTEENDRDKSQNLFDRFITETNLYDESNKICKMASFRTYPFIFHGVNPRTSDKEEDWIREWKKIIEEWDKRDGKIDEILSVFGGSRIYHIFPHIPLSLAFMLGASVNLRRSIVLYHKQEKHENKNFYKVIDLIDPRVVSHKPIDQSIPEPEVIYDKNTNIEKPKDKLILHIGITKRHDFPEFSKHSDYKKANSICLLYKQDIDPEKDWLPYVQRLIEKIIPLIGKYNEIDICISTPSVIAFALGMALSRTPKIKICKFNSSSQYAPIH